MKMATGGDKEFDAYYKAAVKSSTVDLVTELKKAFTHSNSHARIDSYGKDEVLNLIIACRRGQGANTLIK